MKSLTDLDNFPDSSKEKNRKKHVLFLLSGFNIGGAEVDVLNLSNALVDKGYQVTISSKGGVLESKLSPKVKTLHLPVASRNRFISNFNKLRILFYCITNKVTILNPQSIKGVLNSALAAKLLKIPLISTIHNLVNPGWMFESAELLNSITDVNVFVSEYERQRFIQAGLQPELSRVIYSGINLDNFPIKQASEPKTDHEQKIGIVGRLSQEKGVQFGIKAFAEIARQYPKTTLMIVGSGPEKQNLMTLAHKFGLEKQVIFTGERTDVANLLAEIDFLVLPSLTESLSVVAREAMAVGKPVICSNVGGMSELIEHENNGLLVPAGDVSELSKAMEDFLTKPDKVKRMGQNSKILIEAEFSLPVWVNKMDILYRKVSGERIKPCCEKRNILYLTTRFPFPTTKGDKLRAYYQIRELSKRHNVFLLSMFRFAGEKQYFHELEKYCTDIITVCLPKKEARHQRFLSHFTRTPSVIAFFYSKQIKKLLPKVIFAKDIDTVFCQLIRAGQYALNIKNVWKVIDFVDALSLNIERNYEETSFSRQKLSYFFQMHKVRHYEQMVLKAFHQATIISETDRQFLGNENIYVSPNGVVQDIVPESIDSVEEKSIIFTGNMNYWPNEDAVRFLVEKIVPNLPQDIKVYIVGINDNPKVNRYANNQIIITGKVPCIAEYIQQVMVAVCPMRLGSGQQNKVLEAMAAGVPVVATSIANLGVKATPDCMKIADDPIEFANAIKEFLDDHKLRLEFRDNALKFIKRFKWSKIVTEMESQLWLNE